jgi:hypothetical protein
MRCAKRADQFSYRRTGDAAIEAEERSDAFTPSTITSGRTARSVFWRRAGPATKGRPSEAAAHLSDRRARSGARRNRVKLSSTGESAQGAGDLCRIASARKSAKSLWLTPLDASTAAPDQGRCAFRAVGDACGRPALARHEGPAGGRPVALRRARRTAFGQDAAALVDELGGGMLKKAALWGAPASGPLLTGNRATLLADGPAAYDAMLAAIRGARHDVNIERFIYDDRLEVAPLRRDAARESVRGRAGPPDLRRGRVGGHQEAELRRSLVGRRPLPGGPPAAALGLPRRLAALVARPPGAVISRAASPCRSRRRRTRRRWRACPPSSAR